MAKRTKRATRKPSRSRRSGNQIVLNNQTIELRHHPTDFTVLAPVAFVESDAPPSAPDVEPMTESVTRVRAGSASRRDQSMRELRQTRVVHHIYERADTGEEIVIDDRLFLRLRTGGRAAMQDIADEFHLDYVDQMADTWVLRVTDATGMNPVKASAGIAARPEVAGCSPHVRVPLIRYRPCFETKSLLSEQWYLTSVLTDNPDVDPRASIQAPEAWSITAGDPSVVVAVMDDGFDLGHPAFTGVPIHPQAIDFADTPNDASPEPGPGDFHGTPVASIAVASAAGDGMVGVAHGCTLLPIRIGFGLFDQVQTLREFRHASRHADVVNCSFGFPPLTFDLFDPGFRREMTEMTRTGGRRSRGLVIVFAAGNDDAPTRLSAADNVNGVRFLGVTAGGFVIREIAAGSAVFSAYPSIPGIVVVGAMSSRRRKSGYSNWGPDITVTAPSSNGHELNRRDPDFNARYPGAGQIAASNRPTHGQPLRNPLRDQPSTPLREDFFGSSFGGTSGAAPVVSGVCGLMLSVNPDLTAEQVARILMATADQDLDPATDLADDPNLQGITGEFVAGRSNLFGSGKVNALRAVQRARALAGSCGGAAPALATGVVSAPALSALRPTSAAFETARMSAVANVIETETVAVKLETKAPFSRLFIDNVWIPLDDDGTGEAEVTVADDHYLYWEVIAPPGTEYMVSIANPVLARWSKTYTVDGRQYDKGQKPFGVRA